MRIHNQLTQTRPPLSDIYPTLRYKGEHAEFTLPLEMLDEDIIGSVRGAPSNSPAKLEVPCFRSQKGSIACMQFAKASAQQMHLLIIDVTPGHVVQDSQLYESMQVELVACPVREDLFEDGGAIKAILKGSEGRVPRSLGSKEQTVATRCYQTGTKM